MRSDPDRFRIPAQIVGLLAIATRRYAMYSPRHPAFQDTMGRLTASLQAFFKTADRFALRLFNGQILVGQRLIPSNPLFPDIAADLSKRGIQGIHITKGFTRKEITSLVSMLSVRPEDLSEDFAYEEALRNQGVVRIWVQTVHAPTEESAARNAVLEGFLLGEMREADNGDALPRFLLENPAVTGRTISTLLDSERVDTEQPDQAGWIADRLIRIMDPLFRQDAENRNQDRRRLVELVEHLDFSVKLAFFRGVLARPEGPPGWGKGLVSEIPPASMAELIAHAAIGSDERRDRMAFLQSLVLDRKLEPGLLAQVDEKLEGHGVSKRDVLETLAVLDPSLDRRLARFPEQPGEIRHAPAMARFLVDAGRVEQAEEIVQRFFNALAAETLEARREAAAQTGEMMEVLMGRSAVRHLWRRALKTSFTAMQREGDPTVLRVLTEGLETHALGRMRPGQWKAGLSMLKRAFDALEKRGPAGSYLDRRKTELADKVVQMHDFQALVGALPEMGGVSFRRALWLIGRTGDVGVEQLVEALGKEQQLSRRKRFIGALIEMGDASMAPLLNALRDPRWYLARNAALILGALGDTRAAEPLITLLAHPDARVRKEVVQALGNLPTQRSREAVLKALDDPAEMVRLKAMEILQTLGERSACPKIRRIALNHEKKGQGDPALRIRAVHALGSLGDDADVQTLKKILSGKRGLHRKEELGIRRAAVAALGELWKRRRSPEALYILENVMESDPLEEIRLLAEKKVRGPQPAT